MFRSKSQKYRQDLSKAIMWNNKFIRIGGKSVYFKNFAEKGILKADLHGTTLSHTTTLRHELFRVNQTYISLTTVVCVKNIVVGF